MEVAIKNAVSFVKYVLDQICENKSEIKIESQKDELGILITITVATNDMGKLIGKSGQTISAIRTLVRIIGAKENERINLKISEPES